MKNKYESSINNKVNPCYIFDVEKNSIAKEIGISKGYKLITINNEKVFDILDYKFLISDEYIELEVENLDKEIEIFEIEKDVSDDLGLIFESDLIDKPKNCLNKCIFCFMDQLPPNVRETLIFKDDDYRLSFFSGNYITLTNMLDNDIQRIIKYKISPINISVHATDEDVRCKILNNKNAGKVLKYLDDLYNNGILMNFQIVLCKNINDKLILNKTLEDLSKYAKYTQSISIVPVGISRYRTNLFELKSLNKQDCAQVINQVNIFQKQFKKEFDSNLVYLADEFYLKANIDIPNYSYYEDFCQLENGVGMIAVFNKEFSSEILKLKKKVKNIKECNINILTGKITYEFMLEKIKILKGILPDVNINLIAIENKYFGENITVTGLMVGNDIIDNIKDIDKDSYILIPDVCLKDDIDIFLDDVNLDDIKKINKNTIKFETSAKGLIDCIYSIIR